MKYLPFYTLSSLLFLFLKKYVMENVENTIFERLDFEISGGAETHTPVQTRARFQAPRSPPPPSGSPS